MRIAITGSTGLIGSALVEALGGAAPDRRGHEIVRLRRSRAAARAPDSVYWDPARGEIDAAGLEGVGAVIHLAAESLFALWTPGRKRRIRESRMRGTELLSRTLARLRRPPEALLSGSAVGYYGSRPPDETLTEDSPVGTGFLAELGREWEAATEPAADAGIRVVRMRTAVVLSPAGGMLEALLPLFRLGLGGRLGRGAHAMSWIAIDDVVGAVRHVLGPPPETAESPDGARHGAVPRPRDPTRDRGARSAGASLSGPVNFAAPNPVSHRDLVRTLARVLRRPAPWVVPAPMVRLAPGGMGEEVLLASQRAVPKKLLDSGYRFMYPELEDALRHVLGREEGDDGG